MLDGYGNKIAPKMKKPGSPMVMDEYGMAWGLDPMTGECFREATVPVSQRTPTALERHSADEAMQDCDVDIEGNGYTGLGFVFYHKEAPSRPVRRSVASINVIWPDGARREQNLNELQSGALRLLRFFAEEGVNAAEYSAN